MPARRRRDPARYALREYGNAIKELAGAGIFPGDMLLKNFGVTRHDRVVFYDYDEIQPITEVTFRRIPPAASYEEELAAEPYWRVGDGDVFPEQFERFLVANPRAREIFYEYHRDLLDPAFWAPSKSAGARACSKTCFRTPKRSGFLDDYALLPRLQARGNAHVAARHAVILGKKLDQRLVRFTVAPARPAHFDPIAVLSSELRARRPRLHVQIEDQNVAAAMRRWLTTINST